MAQVSVDYVISACNSPHDIDRADIAVSKDGFAFTDRYGNADEVLKGLANTQIKKLLEENEALVEALGAVINMLPEGRKQMIIRELEKVTGQ